MIYTLLDKFGVHHTVAFDGSPMGIKREHGVDRFSDAVAVPATVSGEPSAK
jgi:hypothetical protein